MILPELDIDYIEYPKWQKEFRPDMDTKGIRVDVYVKEAKMNSTWRDEYMRLEVRDWENGKGYSAEEIADLYEMPIEDILAIGKANLQS